MPRRYTKEQKHLIKQCIIDADRMGLDRAESMAYVKSRLGLDEKSFSAGSYKKYGAEALSDDNNVNWIHIMQDKVLLNSIENVFQKWK